MWLLVRRALRQWVLRSGIIAVALFLVMLALTPWLHLRASAAYEGYTIESTATNRWQYITLQLGQGDVELEHRGVETSHEFAEIDHGELVDRERRFLGVRLRYATDYVSEHGVFRWVERRTLALPWGINVALMLVVAVGCVLMLRRSTRSKPADRGAVAVLGIWTLHTLSIAAAMALLLSVAGRYWMEELETIQATVKCDGRILLLGLVGFEQSDTYLYVAAMHSSDKSDRIDWIDESWSWFGVYLHHKQTFTDERWTLALPYWLSLPMLAVAAVIAPGAAFIHAWRRLRTNGCIHCGYDLRASAGSCPECGAPIDQAALPRGV